MDSIILKEISQKHNLADLILSIFFIIVYFILYIICFFLFGNINTNKFPHKKYLSYIIFYDIILRIAKIFISTFVFSLIRELIITTLVSIQFFLTINSFNIILTDKLNENLIENDLGIKYPILLTILFFILSFMHEFSTITSLTQYILAIVAIFFLGRYAQNKIQSFFSNITKKHPNYKENIFFNLIFLIPIYFYIFYIIKIFSLISKNKLYFSYMEMISEIFKESGKYLLFILLIAVYYIFNKYLNEDKTQFENNISNVVVYKDNEELVGKKN